MTRPLRRRHLLFAGGATALACALAVAAEAQAPSPSPSPSPAPVPSPSPLSVEPPPLPGGQVTLGPPQSGEAALREALAPTRSRWDAEVSLGGLWEENPRFEVGGEETRSFGEGAEFALARHFVGRRSRALLSGFAAGTHYHEVSGLDNVSYGGGLALSARTGERTTFTMRHSYSSTYARDQALLAANGILLSNTVSRTYTGDVGFETRLGRQVTLAIAGGYRDVRFDDDVLEAGALALGDATLNWRLGASDTMLVGYNYQRLEPGDVGERDAHTGFLGWDRRLGARWHASLQGGGIYLSAGDGAAVDAEPYASADLTGTYPRGTISLRYGRSVSAAYGLGRSRIVDLASATARRLLGRSVEVAGTASYGLSRDPSDEDFQLRTTSAGGVLRVRLARRASMGAYYTYLDSREEPRREPPISGHRVALTMSLGRAW